MSEQFSSDQIGQLGETYVKRVVEEMGWRTPNARRIISSNSSAFNRSSPMSFFFSVFIYKHPYDGLYLRSRLHLDYFSQHIKYDNRQIFAYKSARHFLYIYLLMVLTLGDMGQFVRLSLFL